MGVDQWKLLVVGSQHHLINALEFCSYNLILLSEDTLHQLMSLTESQQTNKYRIKVKIITQLTINRYKQIKLKFKTNKKKKITFKEAKPGNNKLSINSNIFKCIL
jgi:hypothetical protein